MSEFQLRRATMADAKMLFDWRNDPETCAASINSDPPQWEGHQKWLDASLCNPERALLIAEVDGVPVGTVRIDHGEETELSWTVAPDQRGKGIAKQMVELACPPEHVVAKIKPENVASQKVAESAGFMLVEEGELQVWERN